MNMINEVQMNADNHVEWLMNYKGRHIPYTE